ncbi:MAG TPA: hypothetical protein VEH52_04780 [Gaiellaceae bacterium]|nr:hypothetical protein [Gaiellaceae bacterium]
MPDWRELAEREESRYLDGEARLPDSSDPDARQRQLTRMGNAAGGAALALRMNGDRAGSAEWFIRASVCYRESFEDAPPGSWGRPIGAIKSCILADDWVRAEDAANWALDVHAGDSDSPIGRYAACLACLVLGRWEDARVLADDLRTHDGFPRDVGDALAFVAADDPIGYWQAVELVLDSFEQRDEYLEDVPVADTVLVLQALALRRGIEVELESALLPSR